MRILFAAPLLLLGACQVTEDKANSETTIEYNQDVAENAAADIGNTAENVGGAIANSVENTADKGNPEHLMVQVPGVEDPDALAAHGRLVVGR